MCGRFVSSSTPDELAAYFGVDQVAESVLDPVANEAVDGGGDAPAGPRANFNVAPTQDVFAVIEHRDAQERVVRHLDAFFWGLIPSWAKEAKIGSRMINARAETLAEKNAYKSSFKKRRCLIPADGFYEWQKLDDSKRPKKQPMFMRSGDGSPLAFAGLWSVWRGPDKDQEPLRSVTIITTTPNDTMAPIHDRMPVILGEDAWSTWLDRDNDDLDALGSLLVPAPDDLLTTTPVSTQVNNVRNNGSELIEEAERVDA